MKYLLLFLLLYSPMAYSLTQDQRDLAQAAAQYSAHLPIQEDEVTLLIQVNPVDRGLQLIHTLSLSSLQLPSDGFINRFKPILKTRFCSRKDLLEFRNRGFSMFFEYTTSDGVLLPRVTVNRDSCESRQEVRIRGEESRRAAPSFKSQKGPQAEKSNSSLSTPPEQPLQPSNQATPGKTQVSKAGESAVGILLDEEGIVRSIVSGSAGEHAGLRYGDRITIVSRQVVNGHAEILQSLQKYAGKKANVQVVRNNAPEFVTLQVPRDFSRFREPHYKFVPQINDSLVQEKTMTDLRKRWSPASVPIFKAKPEYFLQPQHAGELLLSSKEFNIYLSDTEMILGSPNYAEPTLGTGRCYKTSNSEFPKMLPLRVVLNQPNKQPITEQWLWDVFRPFVVQNIVYRYCPDAIRFSAGFYILGSDMTSIPISKKIGELEKPYTIDRNNWPKLRYEYNHSGNLIVRDSSGELSPTRYHVSRGFITTIIQIPENVPAGCSGYICNRESMMQYPRFQTLFHHANGTYESYLAVKKNRVEARIKSVQSEERIKGLVLALFGAFGAHQDELCSQWDWEQYYNCFKRKND